MTAFLPTPPLPHSISIFLSTSTPTTTPRRPRSHPVPSPTPNLTLTPTQTPPTKLPTLTGLHTYLQTLPKTPETLSITLFVTTHCPQCQSVSRTLHHFSQNPRWTTITSEGRSVTFREVDVGRKENMVIGKKLGVEWVPLVQCCIWKGEGKGRGEGGVGVVDEKLVKVGEGFEWLEKRIKWFLDGGFVEDEWKFGEGDVGDR